MKRSSLHSFPLLPVKLQETLLQDFIQLETFYCITSQLYQ